MALKVQRGGEHFDSVHSEHATADSAFRIPHSAFPNHSSEPSQQNRTLSNFFWLRPQAASGYWSGEWGATGAAQTQ